jgi:DNA-binding transcriptional ArsR family regulator
VNGRFQDISQLDRLVHEPARLAVLMILKGTGEADFLYLMRECGLTQGNLSSHLSKLEEAGYVEIEKKFKGKLPLTICRITSKGERALAAYARSMIGFLNEDDGRQAS